MSEDSGLSYSTKQVADSLGLGSAMVRKYAIALETVTGQEIPMRRRDGRQFSPEHFAVISKAKALVDSNNGLSVDTALKMVLAAPESGADTLAAPKVPGSSSELAEALTAAISKGNESLLAELRQLREELRAGRDVPALGAVKNPPQREDGLLVRLAKRLESLLRR